MHHRTEFIVSGMTANRRILLNILATYGRSILNIGLGLFTTRWVLASLGQVDYGLYGVIGGMIAFVVFFNSILSTAVSRFYAYNVGKASVVRDRKVAIEQCRKWFNTAFLIHTIVPTVLIAAGFPLGLYAIDYWLIIPQGKIIDCRWVWLLTCLASYIGMMTVPFSAMYTAKQEIAELTIFSLGQTIANFTFGLYMISHPGDWLVGYAFAMSCISFIPNILICIRAFVNYEECRVVPRYFIDRDRIKQICSFAGWQAFGSLGSIIRGQGLMILVNRCFNPAVNAAMSVAAYVNAGTSTLSSAMQGAFSPAITNACGAGDFDKMRNLAFKSCRLGMSLILIFTLPLMLEISEVMNLWLGEVPRYSTLLSFAMMLALVIDKSTVGHMIAVSAKGEIAAYQSFLGSILILTLPVAWILVRFGMGVYGVAVAIVVMGATCSWGRLYFARKLVGMGFRHWLVRVLVPVAGVSLATCFVGYLVRDMLGQSFLRLVITTIVCEIIFIPGCWLFVMNKPERAYLREKVVVILRRYRNA